MKAMYSKSEYLLLAGIILLALFLRLYELGGIPPALFIDEIWSMYQPYLFQVGISHLSLYSIMVYVLEGTYSTYSLFGSSILFGRLSVAIYGTLLVVIVYFFAKEMFGTKTGLISSTLMAICPWAVLFSRYQIASMAGIFWFTLAAFLVYKGSKIRYRKRLVLSGLGSFTLGLSLYSVVIARLFVPLFLFGLSLLYMKQVKKWTKWIFLEGFMYIAIFLLTSAPVIYDSFSSSSDIIDRSVSFSTYSHASNLEELFKLVGERFFIHLSPDFLMFTGGFSYSSVEGFQQNISAEALLKYSTGVVGMLNYFGIFAYPAIFYLLYKVVRKKSLLEDKLLLWWIFCSLAAVTSAYYDNPNSARAIMGLPALVIVMSVFIGFLHTSISGLLKKKKILKIACSIGIILAVLLPTAYFTLDYFTLYSSRSAKSFDYGYEEAARFLTATDSWVRPIVLYSLPNRNWNLAFYSPEQPINPDKFTVAFSTSNLLAFADTKNGLVQIQKSVNFMNGTIEYTTRIDQSYGGAASSNMQLVSDEQNTLALSIYSQNSTYNPSGYLLSQKVNDQVSYEQRCLDNVVRESEWHAVKLVMNSTLVSLYFDNELVTTFSRGTFNMYSYLKLYGESGGVSFANLKIVNGDSNEITNELIDNISQWQIISGTWEIDEKILHGDSSFILIADSSLNLQLLRENSIRFKVIDTIYYPAGDIALRIILVD